ncbi:hypothetical protein [Pseudovibrio exalbescens]|uniref:hypothetical protein n=1 Tax=Pseudovibrio exalbescens TaxID=197461 RepID=UPI000C9AC212|nr:hypothetical protein [Pseudovibrio exalbescens]
MKQNMYPFDIEDCGIHGYAIIPATGSLTSNCKSASEVDQFIEELKKSLDAAAVEMKKKIKNDENRSLFDEK